MDEQCIKILLVVPFVLLGSGTKLYQHGLRKVEYNFLCPMFVITWLKLLCSLVLYHVNDGSVLGIPDALRKNVTLIARYSAVAAFFCVYDVLSFVNLKFFDPSTYSIFLQTRVVITGIVWEVAFQKRLSWMQRFGLFLICFGGMVKQIGNDEASFNLGMPSLSSNHLMLVVQITINVCAGIANEFLLKEVGAAPLNLQNCLQYMWTLLWCALTAVFCPISGIHLELSEAEAELRKMLGPDMLPLILAFALMGLITSVLLKRLNSIWKAIATSSELFFTAFASYLIFGYPVRLMDLAALCIAVSGVYLYARPAPTPKVEASSN